MHDVLCGLLRAKLAEQTDRLLHLIALVPDGRPGPQALLGHLLDCLAGFCAVLYAARPAELAHFARIRELPVNQSCEPDEAARRVRDYAASLEEGWRALRDEDLARRLPTVFVPDGEAVLTLLLGNLEHFINHKHELFVWLKQAGVKVKTPDLYVLR